MIRYSDKQVICVKDIPSNIFSEAIFILKSSVAEHLEDESECKTKEILLNEAEEIVENYIETMQLEVEEENFLKKQNSQKRKNTFLYLGGIVILLGICITFVILK